MVKVDLTIDAEEGMDIGELVSDWQINLMPAIDDAHITGARVDDYEITDSR
jgi:hypothetical protein